MTLGTDPGQNYGHQIFEQVAISNNAWPFDDDGNVTMNTPEMIEALEFYTSLQDPARCPARNTGAGRVKRMNWINPVCSSTAPTSWTTWLMAPGLEAGGNGRDRC